MKKEISSTKYKKNAIIYFFIFFLPFTITILLVYHIIYQSQQDLKQINFEQLQNYFVQKKKESFLKFLKDAEKHLSFLKETVQISLDDKKIDESERDNLIKYFINFSSRFNIYHQIRLIDKTGKEFIRVDNNGKSFSVDKKNLQDKSDRDYYKQSIVLKDNEYYISKPDLNIENKKIEKPLRPVIRISETLNKDNELYYILIFNIDLKKILKDLSDNAEQNNQIYLADNNGNLFISDKKEEEWSHIIKDNKDIVRFQDKFPNAWKGIKNNKNGIIYCDLGSFTFDYIDLSTDSLECKLDINCKIDDYILKIISYRNNRNLFFKSNYYRNFTKYRDYSLILFLSAIFSFLSSRILLSRKRQKEQLEYYAARDNMTGLYNRRSVLEIIKSHYLTSKRYGRFFTICFADVNGLKTVNDTFGHDLGDILIISFADILKKSLRESDVISRIGGDEFIVLFTDSDIEKAKKGWLRVLENIKSFNKNELYPFKLSVSTGFSEFNPRIPKTVDTMINEADSNMYTNKAQFKETGEVIF